MICDGVNHGLQVPPRPIQMDVLSCDYCFNTISLPVQQPCPSLNRYHNNSRLRKIDHGITGKKLISLSSSDTAYRPSSHGSPYKPSTIINIEAILREERNRVRLTIDKLWQRTQRAERDCTAAKVAALEVHAINAALQTEIQESDIRREMMESLLSECVRSHIYDRGVTPCPAGDAIPAIRVKDSAILRQLIATQHQLVDTERELWRAQGIADDGTCKRCSSKNINMNSMDESEVSAPQTLSISLSLPAGSNSNQINEGDTLPLDRLSALARQRIEVIYGKDISELHEKSHDMFCSDDAFDVNVNSCSDLNEYQKSKKVISSCKRAVTSNTDKKKYGRLGDDVQRPGTTNINCLRTISTVSMDILARPLHVTRLSRNDSKTEAPARVRNVLRIMKRS